MAIDHALLDRTLATGQAFLRCYRWEPHCLSFGRHEPALRRYDIPRIRALGLDCVRRPTGGRAVWHARELTYCITAPLLAFGGLREAYGAIHRMIAVALGRLGVEPRLAPRSAPVPGVASGPCFAAPVGGEVLVLGKKVVGSAQLRVGDAFLQHGSVLLEDDQSLVSELAGLGRDDTNAAPLSALLPRAASFGEVADAMAAAAAECFGPDTLSDVPRDIESAAQTHADTYRSREWTWMR